MSRAVIIVIVLCLAGGLFLFFVSDREYDISPEEVAKYLAEQGRKESIVVPDYEGSVAPAAIDEPLTVVGHAAAVRTGDIGPQPHLTNPPDVVRAAYSTSWSASSRNKMQYLIDLIERTELNALVIDIKDFSGYIAYDSGLDLVEEYGAEQIRIPRLNSLIKELHDHGIYVIARISVFQDPVLAGARPDLAVQSSSTGKTWYDRKGLSWTDAAAREVWEYNVAIAKEAAERGFDEINFDYVRFPSDGDLSDMVFTHWDRSRSRHAVLKNFFAYIEEQMKPTGAKISGDLFGLTASQPDDLGIGQIIEDAYPFFDSVAPMVYPSHYAQSFLGFANPAEHPYEVVAYSSERAFGRALKLLMPKTEGAASSTDVTSTLEELPPVDVPSDPRYRILLKYRPWLQDFDLGADYDAEKVRGEIQAVYDAACKILERPSADCEGKFGYMLWSPSNIYTTGALKPANGE